MTIDELRLQLDIHRGSEEKILRDVAGDTGYNFYFVDSCDGQCYLFKYNGKPDDISKITVVSFELINKDIQRIIIPASVKKIYCDAFYKCVDLKRVVLPDLIEGIDDWAFSRCYNLIDINLPDNIERIGNYAFHRCHSLKQIVIPCSIKQIGTNAFVYCNLKNLIFKGKTFDQVKSMAKYPWGIEDESIIKCIN